MYYVESNLVVEIQVLGIKKYLPFLEIRLLVVLGLFFMNSPKKLNAPAE